MSETEQKCRQCKVKKPLVEFPKAKKNGAKNGYMKTCLECKPEKKNIMQWKMRSPEFPPDKRLKFFIRECHTRRNGEEKQDESETTDTWFDTFEEAYKVYKEREKSSFRLFENGKRYIDLCFIEEDDFVNIFLCCWAR